MNAEQIAERLIAVLDSLACDEDMLADAGWDEEDGQPGIQDVRSFNDAGVMTSNAGLVLTTDMGEYQITVVRSR